MKSKLQMYSIGKVAENKKVKEKTIHVLLVEDFFMYNGDLKKEETTIKAAGVNADDEEYELELKTTNTVVCHWLGDLESGNRSTPPDVCRDERVIVWRYADQDKFYWTSLGLDHDKRTRETIRYVIKATDEENVPANVNNSYFIEMSSHSQMITLGTSQALGEPFSFTFQLDTRKGTFTFTDNDGTVLKNESTERKLTYVNKDETSLTINKTKIDLYAKGEIHAKSDKRAWVEAPKIDLGEESSLEPSVLGDKLAEWFTTFSQQYLTHQHMGPFGIITSNPIVPTDFSAVLKEGMVYSKKNRNQ
jgi:hypothetical protein